MIFKLNYQNATLYWVVLLIMIIRHVDSANLTDSEHEEKRKTRHHRADHILISAEKRLVKRLLTNYERIRQDGRPVHNDSIPVPVAFGLGLVQMELNEKDAVLALSMWTRYQWKDDYLMWDPQKYDGVRQVNLETDYIWCPDIMLYNTADVRIEQRQALAVVGYDGTVTWYPHSIFRATCSIDIANYPFDEQHCYLAFGSWTHNSKEIDLEMGFPGGIDLSTFNNDAQESSSWQILNVTAVKSYMPTPDEHPNFAVLTFEIHMRRRVVFSSYILTLPCIFLASLTLVVFWLPPERPDRIGLAMAVFSSFMVLLLILVEAAPPTAASIPRLGVYYCFNMVIIVMAVIISAAVVKVSRGNGKPVPAFLQGVMLTISKLLCLNVATLQWCCCPEQESSPQNTGCLSSLFCNGCSRIRCCKKTALKNSRSSNAMRLAQQVPLGTGQQVPLCRCSECEGGHECGGGVCNDTMSLKQETEDIDTMCQITDLQIDYRKQTTGPMYSMVKQIRQSMDRWEEKQDQKVQEGKLSKLVATQWKETAYVMDRFIFVLYLILMTISLSFFFPKPFTE